MVLRIESQKTERFFEYVISYYPRRGFSYDPGLLTSFTPFFTILFVTGGETLVSELQ